MSKELGLDKSQSQELLALLQLGTTQTFRPTNILVETVSAF